MASSTQVAEGGAGRATARVRLRCWGDFAAADAATGEDLKPRGRKARALLAYLALHPGKAVGRERLAGLLWGDRGEEQARASLRQAILELKPLNGDRGALDIGRDHVTVNPAVLVTDLDEMRAAAASGDYATLLAALPESDERLFANLEGLGEGFDDWLAIERTRQRDALLTLIADASATALAHGQTRHARALHARQRELDPAAGPTSLEKIEPTRPKPQDRQPAPPASPGPERKTRHPWRVAALLAFLLFAGLAGVAAWQRSALSPATEPAVAVLPFKSLSGPRDAYFAEGLSEELTAQLARGAGLRVAGRTSASQFKGRSADLAEVGRKLGVAYVLEGSVRSDGNRVRVNVALAQASDGIQLWAETFDGTLDDIFAIQARIGAQVAARLQRRLADGGTSAAAQATSGAVYTAYLTARALIRERNLRAMLLAREHLERALALDPGFAPAWSSMAQVKRWEGNAPGAAGQKARKEALADARRALALAPDLAEAHGVLGMILGFDHPEGQRHIKRAAALDPDNAEFQFWLGHVHSNEPDFAKMLTAYRRAFAIDPLWTLAHDYAALSAWRMGYREEAREFVRRVEREGSRHDAHMARGFLATYAGDLSGAIMEFGAARAATSDVGKQARAAYERIGLYFNLGQLGQAQREWASCRLAWAKEQKQPLGMPERHAAHLALARGELPSLAKLAAVSRQRDPAGDVLIKETAERLIKAGRARDVVALYESPEGLLGLSSRRPPAMSLATTLEGVPVVAIALTAVGRRAEAERLLGDSDRLIGAALRRSGGEAPADFYAQAAETWALLGKRELALAGLHRARRNGWINANLVAGDLADDIADEPAFASLRGDPSFEAIRARMNAHLARERRELSDAVPL